jgi:hypothetical protein
LPVSSLPLTPSISRWASWGGLISLTVVNRVLDLTFQHAKGKKEVGCEISWRTEEQYHVWPSVDCTGWLHGANSSSLNAEIDSALQKAEAQNRFTKDRVSL